MIITCIGDSITEGDYGVFGKRGIANVHAENYPYFLAKNTGWEVRNFGKCGYRASHMLRFYEEGNVDCRNSDIILIMLGANGGFSITDNTADNDAYREIIRRCRSDAPDSQIVLMTPTHVTENPEFSNCGYKNNMISGVDFTRKLAKEENLPLIETALIPEFTPENETVYQANDGLHFVEAGYKVIAAFIESELRKQFQLQ